MYIIKRKNQTPQLIEASKVNEYIRNGYAYIRKFDPHKLKGVRVTKAELFTVFDEQNIIKYLL